VRGCLIDGNLGLRTTEAILFERLLPYGFNREAVAAYSRGRQPMVAGPTGTRSREAAAAAAFY